MESSSLKYTSGDKLSSAEISLKYIYMPLRSYYEQAAVEECWKDHVIKMEFY